MELPDAPPVPNPGFPPPLMHKNRLQEYVQRSALPLPVYQTINEGPPHDPRFRSAVTVDGATYKSARIFQNRKAAEQDVARIALESIIRKIKDEGLPQVSQDTTFCKSTLNEFAVKMHLLRPTYLVSEVGGLLPIFISSLVFEGKTYVGSPAKTKKEAEQKAARAAIQSILGNSSSRTVLSQIIKSKAKLFASIQESVSHNSSSGNAMSGNPTPESSGGAHVNALQSAQVAIAHIKCEMEAAEDSFVVLADGNPSLSTQSSAVALVEEICNSPRLAGNMAQADDKNGGTQNVSCSSKDPTTVYSWRSNCKRKLSEQEAADQQSKTQKT